MYCFRPKQSELRKELCLKRKRFKKLIIKKKVENQANTLQKIISIKNNPKEYWRLLDSLRKNDRETNDYVRAIDSDRWVKMFKSLLQSGRTFDEDSSIPIVSNENYHPTMSNDISLTELKNSTKKLKHNKSAGLDQILNEMIICCVEVYPDIFLKLFNNLLHYGVFPEIWSQSMIVPFYKKGNKMLETNYRGITLLSCMGKFFNVIINERITNFAISNGIIKQEQFGFIKGNRTSDCLMILHSLADYFMNKKKTKLYTAFIDFQKAYDKVPRDILLSKLYSVGIRGDVFKVIKNIYQNEKTSIRIGNKRTEFFDVNIGVKQGCILSPTLFNIFLSDLPQTFNEKKSEPATIGNLKIGSLFWADDIVILSETKTGLQNSLDQLKQYCVKNEMEVNVEKTKCMIFNKGGRTLKSNQFFYNENEIETVSSFSYMGFMLTPSFNVKRLLDDLYKRDLKAYYKLRNCLGKTFRNHISLSINLFDSLVNPILTYGIELFWGCLKQAFSDMNPIEKLNIKL